MKTPNPPITIRPAQVTDAHSIAVVHVKTWQIAYAKLMPAQLLDNLQVAEREQRWLRRLTEAAADEGVWVAENTHGEIMGFAHAKWQRAELIYPAELNALYILPSAKRQGIGQQLMTGVAKYLVENGINSMALWVLIENHPARRFYEHLGGRLLDVQKDFEVEDICLKIVAYAWDNLQASFGDI